MKKLLLVRYGEIALKGANRNYFINTLMSNIRYALKDIEPLALRKIQSRIIAEDYLPEAENDIIERLKKVSGIVYLTKAYEINSSIEEIKAAALIVMPSKENFTFKVEAKRGDKSFPHTSPEIAGIIGAHVLAGMENIAVDVHNPDIILTIEVRENTYVYYENIPCAAGLPLGTGGTGAVLLSGGIDSPAAAYMMMNRGMKISAVHFHSYPYTSLNAKEKATELSRILAGYNRGMDLYIISLTKIQEQIIQKCNTSYLTVLLRRFMFRLSEITAEKFGIQSLITGESLGQVASQTIESITCTASCVKLPILRPLIGTDKNDIVRLAKKIGTYETSILPYEDCCTIFVPKHPQIKPNLEKVLAEEEKLDIEGLTKEALLYTEKIVL